MIYSQNFLTQIFYPHKHTVPRPSLAKQQDAESNTTDETKPPNSTPQTPGATTLTPGCESSSCTDPMEHQNDTLLGDFLEQPAVEFGVFVSFLVLDSVSGWFVNERLGTE